MFTSPLHRPLALGLCAGALTLQACERPGELCDLGCPAEGVAAGNASISGLASVDSFFSAVVGFGKAALEVRAAVDAELRAIALSLELDSGASAADIRAALKLKLDAAVDGGLKLTYAPPRCTVDAAVAVDAAAKCDAELEPGEAKVECKGGCTVDASAGASCDAGATVVCKGTAPNLDCEGSCTGTCELNAGATCNGTCNGECSAGCSVRGPDGRCAGECTGECSGTCELKAGATCDGKCQGSCEYTAPDGQCQADAEVRCQAEAGASATCEGRCDGEVVPPKAKAECEASVEAEARLRAECTPPALELRWQWSASFADPGAQAEFRAWAEGFRGRFAALLAASARAELVLGAGVGLGEAATDLLASLPGELSGDASLRTAIGLGCALEQLEAVAGVIAEGSTALSGSVGAVAEISAGVAGG